MSITVKKTVIAHTVGEDSKPWRLSKGDEVEEIIKKYNHMGYKFCNIKLPDGKILRHVPCTSLNIK